MSFLSKVFGTRNEKILKQIKPLIVRINEIEGTFKALTDEQLIQKTTEFKQRLSNGAGIDSVLPEAFANCREAARRAIGQRHYDVQMTGGIILHQGKIAEMKTGEGKTLTATLPVYLRALAGKGSHVVTVNDYLAKRDAEWMGRVYGALGLSVGTILHGITDKGRQESYGADITYGTNNEFGFDFLRDNMKTDPSRLVQRGHYFAIVDEVDSILIDEARTPLIISGPTESNTEIYITVNSAIPGLQKDSDYMIDEKSRSVALTEDGISKLEKRLRIDNLYDPRNIEWLHHVQQALRSHMIYKKDVDYVVRDNQVLIVDEHTGRLMPGRRYSDGLHGALEAKEHVRVQQESQTLATITFQNLFRMYEVLSGMTGTADTEAVEFQKIYNLEVTVIPTNLSMTRKDEEDVIFRTAKEKYKAIAEEISQAQKKGQPVLVGTVSVEKSELLSGLLTRLDIPHETLNAKNHAREAQIIEQAGQKGRITIATNMAGRGTDIVLGEGVKDLGGLYVIGTERHDARRIDNQLRGRSGRQGDPGRSKFFLSLEDDLMRIFASDRLSSIMGRLGMEEDEAIISPMVSRAIERAQRRVEEQSFSSRKHLLEYDDVMNQQRQVVYSRRKAALTGAGEVGFVEDIIHSLVMAVAARHSGENSSSGGLDTEKLSLELKAEFGVEYDPKVFSAPDFSPSTIADTVSERILVEYVKKFEGIAPEMRSRIECYVYLQIIDQAWKDHLLSMDTLKDSVSLRGYGQRDPLQEYKREAFQLFSLMMRRIEEDVAMSLIRMPAPTFQREELEVKETAEEDLEYTHPEVETQPAPVAPSVKEDSKLIYHGSRSAMQESAKRPVVQTIKRDGAKVGRNDPCPCGSGKKYKKCHGVQAADGADDESRDSM
jgi:preprotein translocase subunit SecA